jgi:DNA-binding CsgD family transcriptional regulator
LKYLLPNCLRKCIIVYTSVLYFTNTAAQPTNSSNTFIQIALQKNDTQSVRALIDSSWEIQVKNKDLALQYAFTALKIAQKNDYTRFIIFSYHQAANVYASHYLADEAVNYYTQAVVIAKEHNEKKHLANIYTDMAWLYDNKSMYQKSVEYRHMALALFKELGDKKREAMVYNALGIVYFNDKQFLKNIEYQQKAITLNKTIPEYTGLVVALGDLTLGYYTLYKEIKEQPGKYIDSALIACREALDVLYSHKDIEQEKYHESYLLEYMGEVYFLKKDYPQAKKYITNCLRISDSLNYLKMVCSGNLLMGNILTEESNYSAAEEYYQKALKAALVMDVPVPLNDCYTAMAAYTEKAGDYRRAMEYHKKISALKDTLFTAEKTKAINNLQIKYETRQKELRIIALKKQNLFIIALAIAGLALLALLFRSYRLNKKVFRQKEQLLQEENKKISLEKEVEEKEKKQAILARQLEAEEKKRMQLDYENTLAVNALKQQQLQQEVDFKYRELTSYVVQFEKKNDLLIQIKSNLQQIKKPEEGTASALKSVNKLIDQNLNLDKDFDTFKLHFENVHPDFFAKLQQYSPDHLSQLDLRHCAYMRLNLSTKEVANLLNVEAKSIRTTRYRIKQKLNLEKETDLAEFINKL